MRCRLHLLIAPCAIAFASPSHAQKLECVQPPANGNECVLEATKTSLNEYIVLRLLDASNAALAGADVAFSPAVPALSPLTAKTGPNGEVTTSWSGPIDAAVTIVASAKVGNGFVEKKIIIRPPKYTLTPLHFPDLTTTPSLDYWYVERQLGHAYAVIVNDATPEQCPKILVVFRQTSSGGITPDSVYAKWVPKDAFAEPTWMDRLQRQVHQDPTPACIALTRWKLGKEVGEHHLRAGLVGQPSQAVVFRARARALPRLIAGLTYAKQSAFNRTKRLIRRFELLTRLPAAKWRSIA